MSHFGGVRRHGTDSHGGRHALAQRITGWACAGEQQRPGLFDCFRQALPVRDGLDGVRSQDLHQDALFHTPSLQKAGNLLELIHRNMRTAQNDHVDGLSGGVAEMALHLPPGGFVIDAGFQGLFSAQRGIQRRGLRRASR